MVLLRKVIGDALRARRLAQGRTLRPSPFRRVYARQSSAARSERWTKAGFPGLYAARRRVEASPFRHGRPSDESRADRGATKGGSGGG